MAKIWISYARVDNQGGDINFIAQTLESLGIKVQMDIWDLIAGRRLWDQIADFITNPQKTDAWVFVATTNSLSSESCKEEFAYALKRALKERGETFPVITLFPGMVDESLIPPAIQVRLYVSQEDSDWAERVQAAIEGRAPSIARQQFEPYEARVHENPTSNRRWAIELRPRAGVWSPFIVGVPVLEKDRVNPDLFHGPKNNPTALIQMHSVYALDPPVINGFFFSGLADQATPTISYFLLCDELPSEIVFQNVATQQAWRVPINLG